MPLASPTPPSSAAEGEATTKSPPSPQPSAGAQVRLVFLELLELPGMLPGSCTTLLVLPEVLPGSCTALLVLQEVLPGSCTALPVLPEVCPDPPHCAPPPPLPPSYPLPQDEEQDVKNSTLAFLSAIAGILGTHRADVFEVAVRRVRELLELPNLFKGEDFLQVRVCGWVGGWGGEAGEAGGGGGTVDGGGGGQPGKNG